MIDRDSIHYAMTILMSRPNLGGRIKLGPEQEVCIDFADRMRSHVINDRYKGIWCFVPNEGLRHRIVGAILRAMGLISGATDYYFIWTGGACLIEMKAPSRKRLNHLGKWINYAAGTQSETQKYFQKWCRYRGIEYHICKSADEAESVLRSLGALR